MKKNKNKKASYLSIVLVVIGTVIVIGCASITPIDVVWPVSTNPILDTYVEFDVPSIKVFGWNYTTLAFAKAQRYYAQNYHMTQEFLYTTGMKVAGTIIEPAEKARDATMQGLMALGAGTPAIGFLTFLAGKKKKRPEDYTADQYEEAKRMEPPSREDTTV